MKRGKDSIGVAVAFFCHDGKGKFLMAKRGEECSDERGVWDCGGGGVEHGELLEEAVKREIKEEYGAEVIDLQYLGFRQVHRQHEDGKSHWITFDFKVLVDPAEVRIAEPGAVSELCWVALDELPTPQHSQFPVLLNQHRHLL